MICGLQYEGKRCKAPVKPNLHFFGEPQPESLKHGLAVAEGSFRFVSMENPNFSDYYITNSKSSVDLVICIGGDMQAFP